MRIQLRSFSKLTLVTFILLGMTPSNGLQAQTRIRPDRSLDRSLDGVLDSQPSQPGLSQVTSVSELQDVQPGDWAYEALKSLVERYGCMVGYPDRTWRGNRALSRWEFAAGLNACLNTMERLLQENVAVLREDLDKLKALARNFEQELGSLGTKVDNLEARTAYLEDHTFSTTTKLEGETVIGLVGVAGGEKKQGTEQIPQIPTLGYRSRLQFSSSFTGKDQLFTRLTSGNQAAFTEDTGTFQSNLSFSQPQNNQSFIDQLYYYFPASENLSVWVEGYGGGFDDFNNTLNIFDGDGNFGALSRFGTRNSIYLSEGGSGVGLLGQWGDIQVSGGYLAATASNPESNNGLFNGSYGAIAQIAYIPQDGQGGIAFTYRHGYNDLGTDTGSVRSNFQDFTEIELGQAVPTINNSYGLTFSWPLTEKFVLGGWGGYSKAQTLNSLEGQLSQGSFDIWTWAVTLAFPDIVKEGNLAGIIVGMQPWVTSSNVVFDNGLNASDRNTSWHLETFYQYAVNDHISITPGLIVITNPDNDARNAALVLGIIRTTFTF